MVKTKDKNVLGGHDVHFFYLIAAEGAVACSHERSYILYTDSVSNNCPYTAYPCTSGSEYAAGHCLSCTGTGCSEMGYNSQNFSARGSFYLDTASISPFCGE